LAENSVLFYPGKGWISVNQAAVLAAGNKK
jgi:hypothetical protein